MEPQGIKQLKRKSLKDMKKETLTRKQQKKILGDCRKEKSKDY